METAVLSSSSSEVLGLPAGNDHPVIDMPFTAVIDGRQFRGRGLSLVAAYVSGLMDPALLKAHRIVRLGFDFDGFSVALMVEAELRPTEDGSGEARLSFIRPTGPHLPQLRHILNGYIAGDLVGLGQVIAVAGTSAPKGARAAAVPERRLSLRRVMGGFGIGLLSVALLAAVGGLAWQRVFVTRLPTPGIVVSSGETLRATSTGQIMFLNPAAAKGEVAIAIQSAAGAVLSIVMPCDCESRPVGVGEGSTILIGEPVLQLTSPTDQTLVAATLPDALLFDLQQAGRIELTFGTGETVLATPQAQPFVQSASGEVPTSQRVLFVPEQPLGAELLGQPVEVRLVRDLPELPTFLSSFIGGE